MKPFAHLLLPPIALIAAAPIAAQAPAPARPWTPQQAQEVLAKTQTTRLAPDLSHLTAGERQAVAKLLDVGAIFQDLYEQQRHRSALQARAALQRARDPHSADLMKLYRLSQGPVAVTLDNKREPFLTVEAPPPGKNVYPWGITAAEIDAYAAAHPEEKGPLTHLRHVVRRADAATLRADLARLARYPVLDALHPGLKAKLQRLARRPDAKALYGLPYSVAYADEMIRSHRLLHEAADAVERDDQEFARYLRNRARDLLTDDYEAGDASWIRGRFKNLNAQIGAYETYDY